MGQQANWNEMLQQLQSMSPEERQGLQAAVDALGSAFGVYPDHKFRELNAGEAIQLAAMGVTKQLWRNTIVEDWHSEGRLSDGDMMRINAHTTSGVLDHLNRWCDETGIAAGGRTEQFRGVAAAETRQMMNWIKDWLSDPRRELPIGKTVGDLARSDLSRYKRQVQNSVDSVQGRHNEPSA